MPQGILVGKDWKGWKGLEGFARLADTVLSSDAMRSVRERNSTICIRITQCSEGEETRNHIVNAREVQGESLQLINHIWAQHQEKTRNLPDLLK
jgi:hypothetical protein